MRSVRVPVQAVQVRGIFYKIRLTGQLGPDRIKNGKKLKSAGRGSIDLLVNRKYILKHWQNNIFSGLVQ